MKRTLISALIIVLSACSTTHSVIDAKLPEASQQLLAKTEAETLLESASLGMDSFLTKEHWSAVKSLTGVAKAVFILPDVKQAGVIVGGFKGQGILLVRHVHEWSDPIFVSFSGLQAGLLVGGQKFNGAGVILTENALSDILEGNFKLGGAADTTVGPGISGRVAGSKGGIELLMVSENKGVFLGGAFEGVKLQPNIDMNKAVYGEDFDIGEILEKVGGNITQTIELRNALEKTAYQAVFREPRPAE